MSFLFFPYKSITFNIVALSKGTSIDVIELQFDKMDVMYNIKGVELER